MKNWKVAQQAIDYLNSHGWCQGYLQDFNTGAVCLRGALFFSVSRDKDAEWVAFTTADTEIAKLIAKIEGHSYDSSFTIPTWNDQKDRTKEEVIALLEHYILLERAKEILIEDMRKHTKESAMT